MKQQNKLIIITNIILIILILIIGARLIFDLIIYREYKEVTNALKTTACNDFWLDERDNMSRQAIENERDGESISNKKPAKPITEKKPKKTTPKNIKKKGKNAQKHVIYNQKN